MLGRKFKKSGGPDKNPCKGYFLVTCIWELQPTRMAWNLARDEIRILIIRINSRIINEIKIRIINLYIRIFE